MLPIFVTAAMSGGAVVATVSVTAVTISNTRGSPTEPYAEIRVDQDGDIYSVRQGTSDTELNESTDWIDVKSEAPGDYEARITSLAGDTGEITVQTAAENTWYALSSGDFRVRLGATATDTPYEVTFTLEIRKGSSGGALDSATITLQTEKTLL